MIFYTNTTMIDGQILDELKQSEDVKGQKQRGKTFQKQPCIQYVYLLNYWGNSKFNFQTMQFIQNFAKMFMHQKDSMFGLVKLCVQVPRLNNLNGI